MANQYDVIPGTFESVSAQPLGTFILNEWKHFELDGIFKFLVADPVIDDGGGTVPPSAYELAQDDDATTIEVGKTDAILYGQIRITDNAYVGVQLTLDGKNYGTYTSNEAARDYVTSVAAGNVQPGSSSFFDKGEAAEFTDTAGTSIVPANTGEIAKWDSGTSYSVAGTLARIEGITSAATGKASNQNKYPLTLVNVSYWFNCPDRLDLIRNANIGKTISGDMHSVNDRNSSEYQQLLKIGKYELNGVQNDFFLVHRDGTVITGNTFLEDLFDVGGPNQYPYLDLIAPDIVGTRTLTDVGGLATRFQDSGSDFGTLGDLVDDQFQGSDRASGLGDLGDGSFNSSEYGYVTGIGGKRSDGDSASATTYTDRGLTSDPLDDGVNGTPRTGDKTYGPTLVQGTPYIIVMQAS